MENLLEIERRRMADRNTVITASRYDTTALSDIDTVIDKYQTGVLSTTCDQGWKEPRFLKIRVLGF